MGRTAADELQEWEDLALSYALQGLPVTRIAELVYKDESTIRAAMKKDAWKDEWRKRMDPLKAVIVAGLREEMSRRVCDEKACKALKPTDLVAMYKCLADTAPAVGATATTANLRFVFNLPPAEMRAIQGDPMLSGLAEFQVEEKDEC